MREKEFDKLVDEVAERVILSVSGVCFRCGEPSVLERIEKLERNTGRWKPRKHYVSPLHEAFVVDYECSNCHFQLGKLEWNYCPICGAKMKGEEDG